MWLKRDEFNQPILVTEIAEKHGAPAITSTATLVSEELYDQWVPDTNHYPGESLSEGVVYDKPLKENLKA